MILFIVCLAAAVKHDIQVFRDFRKVRMDATARQIVSLAEESMQYYSTVGHLPSSYTEMQSLARSSDQLNDGWGRPLIIRFDAGSDIMHIVSMGADGNPGGRSEDESDWHIVLSVCPVIPQSFQASIISCPAASLQYLKSEIEWISSEVKLKDF
jgi:hypothetical protein